jgi:hypothetical protein
MVKRSLDWRRRFGEPAPPFLAFGRVAPGGVEVRVLVWQSPSAPGAAACTMAERCSRPCGRGHDLAVVSRQDATDGPQRGTWRGFRLPIPALASPRALIPQRSCDGDARSSSSTRLRAGAGSSQLLWSDGPLSPGGGRAAPPLPSPSTRRTSWSPAPRPCCDGPCGPPAGRPHARMRYSPRPDGWPRRSRRGRPSSTTASILRSARPRPSVRRAPGALPGSARPHKGFDLAVEPARWSAPDFHGCG